MYSSLLSYVFGLTILALEISRSPASALIFASSPIKTILAIPLWRILTVAWKVLISSVSGKAIVLLSFFALSLSYLKI
jgi:hypothetical protein